MKESIEFAEGQRLLAQKNYEDAATIFRRLSSEDESGEILYHLGLACMGQSHFEEAKNAFRGALVKDRENSHLVLSLAHCLKTEGRYAEAIEVLNQHGTRCDESIRLLGELHALMRAWPDALPYLLSWIEKNPSDMQTLHLYSRCLLHLQKFAAAAVCLRQVVLVEPKNEAAFEDLIEVCHQLGFYDQSIAHLKRLILLRPKDASLYRRLGLFYGQVSNFIEARKAYWNAYTMDSQEMPKDEPKIQPSDTLNFQASILALTERYSLNQDWQGALKEFTHLSRRFPTSLILMQEIAYIYQCVGEQKRAATYYHKILDREPANLEAMLQLLRIALETEDLTMGASILKKALDAYPEVPEVLEMAGIFHLAMHRFNEAQNYFQQCRSLGFESCGVMLGLSECCLGLSRNRDCVEILREGLKLYPDSPDLMINLVETQLRLRHTRQATDLLKDARQKFPSAPKVYAYSALTEVANGRHRKAGDYWRIVATLPPQDKRDTIHFIKGLIFIRDLDQAKSTLKALGRWRFKTFELMVLQMLIYILERDRHHFSLAWQEVWNGQYERFSLLADEFKSLLNPLDIQFMIQNMQDTARLLRNKPEPVKLMVEFAEKLQQVSGLELVK